MAQEEPDVDALAVEVELTRSLLLESMLVLFDELEPVEEFELDLADNAVPRKVYVDNNSYRIVGLPMYTHNEPEQMERFSEQLSKL